MNEIKQRKGFETRSYKIDSNAEFVEVQYNTISNKLKYKIHLTDIGNELVYEEDNVILGKIFVAMTSLVTLTCIGVYFFGNIEDSKLLVGNALLFGLFSVFGYFKPHKDDILIANSHKVIRLFRNKPNEQEVLEFANCLINLANEKKKEMLINFDLEEDRFMENMQWLLNMRLIDKSEFETLRSEFKLKKLI